MQSMNPAPVRSRSSLTSSAVMSAMCVCAPVRVGARVGRRRGAWCRSDSRRGRPAAGRSRSAAAVVALPSRPPRGRVPPRSPRGLPRPVRRRRLGASRAVAGQQVVFVGVGLEVRAAPPASAATSSSVAGTSSSSPARDRAASTPRARRMRAARSLCAFDGGIGHERHSSRMARIASSLAGMM